jgi:flavodoxin I
MSLSKSSSLAVLAAALLLAPERGAEAFAPRRFPSTTTPSSSALDAVGIFFGTSTGNTETIADMIKEALGDEAEGPFDVDSLEGSVNDNFGKYDALIVGTPTWNTGADTERSGTGWDEIYYSTMQELENLQGKKVAVFGLGDQVSYAENYADATGELHDVFEALGCRMMGYTSMEGYEHEDSKSIRGDKFCGLLCDQINQEDLSEERVQNWIEQLKEEGFLEPSAGGAAVSSTTSTSSPVEEAAAALEEHSTLLDETIEQHSDTGFTPYVNEKTKSTMWVSADGRSCYYTTADATKTSASP